MLKLKTAIQLASLQQPFKKALHTAARLGAKGVEIDARHELRPAELTQTGIRHIRKLLDDLNLRVAAVTFPTRRGYDIKQDLQPRIEGTQASMRMAYQLGARCVVNHIGEIDTAESDATSRELLRQSLVELARFGDREGAHLAALTGGASPEQVRALVEELPEASLQLALDPGELASLGIKPEQMITGSGCPVRHVYITDGVTDPARGRGMEVPVGRGVVDFPTLLGTLEEQGYDGYLCVRRDHTPHAPQEIAHALEYLQALFG